MSSAHTYHTIHILLPIFPYNRTAYFKGYISELENFRVTIYITSYSTNSSIINNRKGDAKNRIYGHCGRCTEAKQVYKNYLELHPNPDYNLLLKKLIHNGAEIKTYENSVVMLYEYDKLKESQIISVPVDSEDQFSILQSLILKDSYDNDGTLKTEGVPPLANTGWLSSSMFVQHTLKYINLLNWLKTTIKRDKKIQLKQANFIFAIIIDLLLGYVVLSLLIQDKKKLSGALIDVLEKLVNSLYSSLKWLMGSPAGLKLNNAFNKMLGKYFSYHIQLWWLFLDVSGEKLDVILHIYQYLGYLGLTFQAAIVCDMICITTFHSYCIYVYAARLFNIQISGLIALLRLFVGRKYNPLRGGIDSCEYTNQELFVGTVAFTILLLLLPTTAMYYTVFTLFRLLSLAVQYVLAKVIHFIQTIPLYVMVLWLMRSPKVAGNIFIGVVSKPDVSPLVLKVEVFSESLQDLVKNFKPPVEIVKPVEWTNLLTNILTGKQIT